MVVAVPSRPRYLADPLGGGGALGEGGAGGGAPLEEAAMGRSIGVRKSCSAATFVSPNLSLPTRLPAAYSYHTTRSDQTSDLKFRFRLHTLCVAPLY
jgi:hypothetical protein